MKDYWTDENDAVVIINNSDYRHIARITSDNLIQVVELNDDDMPSFYSGLYEPKEYLEELEFEERCNKDNAERWDLELIYKLVEGVNE